MPPTTKLTQSKGPKKITFRNYPFLPKLGLSISIIDSKDFSKRFFLQLLRLLVSWITQKLKTGLPVSGTVLTI